MDAASVGLILGVVAELGSLAPELAALATRVQAGEKITEMEVEDARLDAMKSRARWDAAAEHDKES